MLLTTCIPLPLIFLVLLLRRSIVSLLCFWLQAAREGLLSLPVLVL